jgi:hypothetical protein
MSNYKIDQLNASIKNNTIAMNNVKETLTQALRSSDPGAIGTTKFNAQVRALTAQFKTKIDSDKKKLATLQADAKTVADTKAANKPASKIDQSKLAPGLSSTEAQKIFANSNLTQAQQNAYFIEGAAGSSLLVYAGEQPATKGGRKGPSVIPDQIAGPKSLYKNTVLDSFKTDPTIQARVMQAMRNAGATNVNQYTAFLQWSDIVDKAAAAYAGGNGLKLTPMDILNMTLNSAAGAKDKSSDVTTTVVDKQTPQQMSKTINDALTVKLGRTIDSLSDSDKKILMDEVAKYVNVGQKVRTITNKKGETTKVFRGPGYDPASATEKIKALVSKDPKYAADVSRQEGFNVFNFIQNMESQRGGQ